MCSALDPSHRCEPLVILSCNLLLFNCIRFEVVLKVLSSYRDLCDKLSRKVRGDLAINTLQDFDISLNKVYNLWICLTRLLELLSGQRLFRSLRLGLSLLSWLIDVSASLAYLRWLLRLWLSVLKMIEDLVHIIFETITVLIASGSIQAKKIVKFFLVYLSRIIFIA